MMQYVSFANPAYVVADDTLIDVDLVLTEGATPVRYTAGRDDPISANLYADIVKAGGITPYAAPVLTLAEQAASALAAGLTIALSGSITLPATVFPTDPVTTGKIGQVVLALGATGAFPGGAETYPIKDASGTWHIFTPAQYKALATAIAAYVAPLDLIIDGNPLGVTELPPSSVSLTV